MESSMSEPVIIGDATLYHGDCLEIMPTLHGIDAVITDPPYGMAHSGNSHRFSGGTARRGLGTNHGPIVGDDAPFDPRAFLLGSEQIIWGFNHFPMHLQRGTALIWIKRNDAALGSFLSDAEVAWHSRGCGAYAYKQVFAGSSRAIEGSGDPYAHSSHPTQKPVDLMRWCIGRCSNPRTIFDPYMGSGTTGVACAQLGRKFIGIEIERKYFDIACERIDNAYRQMRMFA